MTKDTQRYFALWAAYAMMIFGGWLAMAQLEARLDNIEEEICKVVLIDLEVDLVDQDGLTAEFILDLIDEVQRECGDDPDSVIPIPRFLQD